MLKRPAPRGSKYKKKIDPKTFYVSYEGSDDEKQYFEEVANRVDRRFVHNLKFISVEKSSTDAEPVHVLKDLENRLKDDSVNCKKNANNVAFIVIDTDHHFQDTHARDTANVLQQCKQKGIQVVLTNPCFELWLMCHLEDVSLKSESFKKKLFDNAKVSKHKTFAKREWGKMKGSTPISQLVDRLKVALINEQKINSQCSSLKSMPPSGLYSDVGDIFKQIADCGIDL
ncbi:RloB family protein [Vibrio coralliilyticus]|uniref:RloB family protein n=1 Tax=Vibrio coralliilyticus TaxID=190893 RepID=UPI0003100EE7|nr:RloB family protein [Vibrio coralliilyticus]